MTTTGISTTDAINGILGIDEESPIAQLRAQKPSLVDEVQAYYRSLFEPVATSAAALPLTDRYVVAIRVASHTGSEAVAAWYERLATDAGVDGVLVSRARDVTAPWLEYSSLGAAIRHADLLTTRPADATRSDLQPLKDAGFTPAGIVSLSQVIAFVSYQLRLVAGLRALGGLS